MLQPFVGFHFAVAVAVGAKVAMTAQTDVVETTQQLGCQAMHGFALGCSACIGRLAFRVETALVADANGVAVVSLAVCAVHPKRAGGMHLSVACDVEVVSNSLEATAQVVAVKGFYRIITVGMCGRAVIDDVVNSSHSS